MEKVFKDLDADGDGGVTFREFVPIVTQLAMMSKDLDITTSSNTCKLTFVFKILTVQRCQGDKSARFREKENLNFMQHFHNSALPQPCKINKQL